MKVIAKEHLTAGTLIEYGQADDGSGHAVILYLHDGNVRECRTTEADVLKNPPKPGDIIVEHATHIDWMPFDEFREQYSEVA
ncbi:hypothetical protein PQI07_22435 [Methylobacterium sp. 092160098-2]|uniref:hypothetical protein n=1 Tax=Methylobacterium sp. 092160098-2 TaxID=3025129 RepID=UPI002381A082|nr:hypothetical protein [Methylobacterium sp. 092160098-2]MDE4913441.1 hypothetical protein [Methylobacterium sp. 092160098-2]